MWGHHPTCASWRSTGPSAAVANETCSIFMHNFLLINDVVVQAESHIAELNLHFTEYYGDENPTSLSKERGNRYTVDIQYGGKAGFPVQNHVQVRGFAIPALGRAC